MQDIGGKLSSGRSRSVLLGDRNQRHRANFLRVGRIPLGGRPGRGDDSDTRHRRFLQQRESSALVRAGETISRP